MNRIVAFGRGRCRRHARVALGIALLGLVGCGSRVERPRDVLLLSIDTLRADRLGCYGRPGAGTPHLDALAARGVRFADVVAPSPMTLPSHATLLSGRDTLRHRVRHNGLFALPAETTTLAERFRDAGRRTGAFVASIVLAERFGLDQGFEAYRAPGADATHELLYVAERPAAEVNREALTWVDSIGDDESFFLFVHYMEPHAPYDPPEPERSRFAEDPYQGEVAAADRALGELLDALDDRGRLDETLVLVVSDHGESLGEHGESTHGIFLYQSTLHVPMIAAGPGVGRGVVSRQPVGLVDVAPTLLGTVGLDPHRPLDGRDLGPAMRGTALDGDRSLYAETFVPRFDFGWSELRALRRGAWKYIDAPRPELFALDADPAETRNRFEESAEASRMASAMRELVERVERLGDDPDRVRLSADERRALEGLGYVMGGREHEAGLVDPKDRVAELAALDEVDTRMRRGEHPRAVRLARELLAENPTYLDLRLRLVLALILQGEVEVAAAEGRAFDAAVRDVPGGERIAAQAHLLLGHMYLDHERIEDAAREYEKALAAPQSSKTHDLLAAIYHDLGRDDEAIRILERLVESGDAGERSLEMLRLLRAR